MFLSNPFGNPSVVCARKRVVTPEVVADAVYARKLVADTIEITGGAVTNNTISESKAVTQSDDDLDVVLDSLVRPAKEQVITELHNADFAHGTYRIRSPGTYRLVEDIEFNPNPKHNWMPRPDQEAEYPTPPYQLGFFAAITIECDDVYLDLNQHSLRQSREHYLQQRFFALVETADRPFVPKQGPSEFGEPLRAAHHCRIANGSLGLTSHHGIHGNGNTHILVEDVTFHDFEIAGLAFNGGSMIGLRRVCVTGTARDVPVNATYSHARFLLPFFERSDLSQSISLRGFRMTGQQIKQRLEKEMSFVLMDVQAGRAVRSHTFRNTTKVADGNTYGIVLNQLGVAVGAMPTERDNSKGNNKLFLSNVSISNVRSSPVEVVGVYTKDNTSTAYSNVMAGPVGDVFRFHESKGPKGAYVGNEVSDAQLFLASQGFGSIDKNVLLWASNLLPEPPLLEFVGNGDSMAHSMKGNIGLYVAGGTGVRAEHVTVDGVHNFAKPSTLTNNFLGARASGVVLAACNNVQWTNVRVSDISSESGDAIGLHLFRSSPPTKEVYAAKLQCAGGNTKLQAKLIT